MKKLVKIANKSQKSIKNTGAYELVLLIYSKIHEKIVEFPLNKTEKLTKIINIK